SLTSASFHRACTSTLMGLQSPGIPNDFRSREQIRKRPGQLSIGRMTNGLKPDWKGRLTISLPERWSQLRGTWISLSLVCNLADLRRNLPDQRVRVLGVSPSFPLRQA